jgi:carbamoyl-phosphate synthase large subunit
MKSTGEVMGIDHSFGAAFFKSQLAALQGLPLSGKVFISVKNADKRNIVFVAKKLSDLGFEILATRGTAKALLSNNIPAQAAGKVGEGDIKVLDLIKDNKLKLIINTPSGQRGQSDMRPIRSLAVARGVPCITTLQGAQAAVSGIEAALKKQLEVKSLQEYLA